MYNRAIEYINCNEKKEHWMKVAKDILSDLPDFCDAVPYQVKKVAIRDAFNSFYTNVKVLKKTGRVFSLRFKGKRDPIQSCFIPKSAIKDTGIYYRISGKGIKYAESLPGEIGDSRLVCSSGRWYLTVPSSRATFISENKGRVVAVDPGIRSFMTFFSEDSFGHIGHHDFGKIVRLCSHLDSLLSRMGKETGSVKRGMRKAANRARWKIKDLVSELHNKTAKFFVDNFDVIFLPKFEIGKMSIKATRKIGKKSVRSMLTYAFYKFSQHLKYKCEEYGKVLLFVNEAYTSKMNSFTGEMMPRLGSKEYFYHDGKKVNRDINGARNILCFSLVDSPCVVNSTANVS